MYIYPSIFSVYFPKVTLPNDTRDLSCIFLLFANQSRVTLRIYPIVDMFSYLPKDHPLSKLEQESRDGTTKNTQNSEDIFDTMTPGQEFSFLFHTAMGNWEGAQKVRETFLTKIDDLHRETANRVLQMEHEDVQRSSEQYSKLAGQIQHDLPIQIDQSQVKLSLTKRPVIDGEIYPIRNPYSVEAMQHSNLDFYENLCKCEFPYFVRVNVFHVLNHSFSCLLLHIFSIYF